ncbi:daptide-type RiPP biosynthesis dehydogenase [Streptomyces sp. NPDC056534]|uniref:daptide-type RiPP biosynthesis dehydogenase n=1 Tax=Streptomyces sp. NPDC056534 TaxID=3345857 RepID=UPI0036740009
MNLMLDRCQVVQGISELPKVISQRPASKVHLAYDSDLHSHPELSNCRQLLAADGTAIVRSVPVRKPSTLEDAGQLAEQLEGADSIVAFGGGSLLDSVKLACALMDPLTRRIISLPQRSGWFHGPDRPRGPRLIAIPTTIGTTSEVSQVSVYVKDGQKRAISSPSLQPDVAILDAQATDGMPLEMMLEGCLEIILRCIGPVIGSAGPLIQNDRDALAIAQNVAERLCRIRRSGHATAEDRIRLAEHSIETRDPRLLHGRAPFSVKAWFIGNNLSQHKGVRKMRALANLIPAYWNHLPQTDGADSAERAASAWASICERLPAGFSANPAEGFNQWLDWLEIQPAPRLDESDIRTIAESCMQMWGSGLPMLARVDAETVRNMLRMVRMD